jgi:hypothetical protein
VTGVTFNESTCQIQLATTVIKSLGTPQYGRFVNNVRGIPINIRYLAPG